VESVLQEVVDYVKVYCVESVLWGECTVWRDVLWGGGVLCEG
jgi:hypothetical protein